MSSIDQITAELKGKTGMDEELENDLIRRIAEVKKQGSLVPELNRVDWIVTAAIILVFGVLPIVLVCKGII